jgi:stage IV sporulation protein A
MVLDNPQVIRQGSRYGIKLRAIAPSIHMIKVEVESSFEPIIGSEEQSKQLLDKIMADYDKDPTGIWNSEIFGRTLNEVVNDGIRAKLYLLPENIQYKFRESLEKVVNKGRGGIIAFIL